VTGGNWVGPVGEVFARLLVELIGVVAWLIPVELILVARPLLFDKKMKLSLGRLSGDVVIAIVCAALAHIALPHVSAFGNMPLAGVVGDLFGEVARGLFSTVGSFLIGLTVVALILMERAAFSFIEAAQKFRALSAWLRRRTGRQVGKVATAWVEARQADKEQREAEARASEPLIASPEQADAIIAAFADDGTGIPPIPSLTPPPVMRRVEVVGDIEDEVSSRVSAETLDLIAEAPTPPPPAVVERPADPLDGLDEDGDDDVSAELIRESSMALEQSSTPSPAPLAKRSKRGAKSSGRRASRADGPTIVDTSKQAETKKAKFVKSKSTFALPQPSLLDPTIKVVGGHSKEQLKATARLLEKTLADYGVQGSVQEIHPGPTVTMFEVSPAPGTKVSKVAGLADDLALGLSRKVRIIAPIPGKARIGFEVPNDKRIPVNLRELVESEEFMGLDAPLPCVLGRDIIGRPFFADLASMPHMIVAGATGAGKSVGLNVMLVSLLCRRTPDELRMLMIDPKVVELAPFDRIPHLLFPVVTDMKQAANALKWAVDEMERRYQLFADAGTKNIKTYNRYVKRVRAGELPPPRVPEMVSAIAPDGSEIQVEKAKVGSDATLPDRLPYIVVVVEEFADLIMTQGKEVESSVARLAQKARAAGLHVILATQRPSVDVITGMIKANFPTRIAFRVAQKVDSRTIIDQQGAEHLLGGGDMLVKLNGRNDVLRVQGPFVSEDEVQRVTDHLRAQGEPEYDETIVRGRDDDGAADADMESEPLYDKAVQVVGETQKCSTSWIQRKLGVGYNRAAKIVEMMEKNGVVGPPNGSKPREILISPH
jgi:S-DNA-T family DNA segregation ATPase FtsK/SpoIIIE